MPNAILKRIYAAMVETRLRETRARKVARGPDLSGYEACRVASLIDLAPEEPSSDLPGSVASAFLRGAATPATGAPVPSPPGVLPTLVKPRDRFHMTLGAALALRLATSGRATVLIAGHNEAKPSLWKAALQFAAGHELPLLFVVLPPLHPPAEAAAHISPLATRLGVPGIPVDASDAIALYRVARESLGRARAGGGPALMECVPFVLHTAKARRRPPLPDPIAVLGRILLARGICDRAWLDRLPAAAPIRRKASPA